MGASPHKSHAEEYGGTMVVFANKKQLFFSVLYFLTENICTFGIKVITLHQIHKATGRKQQKQTLAVNLKRYNYAVKRSLKY